MIGWKFQKMVWRLKSSESTISPRGDSKLLSELALPNIKEYDKMTYII